MSAPVRFLVVVIAGWAGVRVATVGTLPGFTVGYATPASASAAPIVATEFPPLPPIEPAPTQQQMQQWPPLPYLYSPALAARIPVFYPVPPHSSASYSAPLAAPPPRPQWRLPSSDTAGAPDFYAPIPPLEDWLVGRFASSSFPGRQAAQSSPALPQPAAQPRFDRLQLSTWALLRGDPSPGALATGGTLGGSQAGARLTYSLNRYIAASLRTSSPVGGSTGAEVAGGIRFTPLRSLPIAITAERRQSISPHSGRSAFALFAEGGLYRQPLPYRFNLDAYLQAGIVGIRSRDLFADGAFAFTRPLYGRVSGGFGIWGGVQPDLYRVDAGPRLSLKVRDNIHAHFDYRQRVSGNARPASGPALTLAADF